MFVVLGTDFQHEVEQLQPVSVSLQALGHIKVQHTQGLSLHMRPPLVLKDNTGVEKKKKDEGQTLSPTYYTHTPCTISTHDNVRMFLWRGIL